MQDHSCCAPGAHAVRGAWYRHPVFLSFFAVTVLVITARFIPLLSPFQQSLAMYLGMMAPFFLLGILIGGVIDHFVPRDYISQLLGGSGKRTIFRSVGLGFLMSACSHGILAIAIELHKKGASAPSVVSFLLASPWSNAVITILLIGLFGWKGLMIVLLALIVALITGFIFLQLAQRGLIQKNPHTLTIKEEFSAWRDLKKQVGAVLRSGISWTQHGAAVLKGSWSLLEMVLGWFTLGTILAALASAYIPSDFFQRWLGPTPLGLLVTLAGATVIETCSEGSAPLAFEIYRQSGALGNAFAFLMVGVATDFTELGLVGSNLGWRVVGWILATNIPMIYLLGLALNSLF